MNEVVYVWISFAVGAFVPVLAIWLHDRINGG
jgi:hypothetical protein